MTDAPTPKKSWTDAPDVSTQLAAEEARTLKALDQIERATHEFYIAESRLHKIRPQVSVVALLNLTANAVTVAAAMNPSPEEAREHYLNYFNETLQRNQKVLDDSPIANFLKELYQK